MKLVRKRVRRRKLRVRKIADLRDAQKAESEALGVKGHGGQENASQAPKPAPGQDLAPITRGT